MNSLIYAIYTALHSFINNTVSFAQTHKHKRNINSLQLFAVQWVHDLSINRQRGKRVATATTAQAVLLTKAVSVCVCWVPFVCKKMHKMAEIHSQLTQLCFSIHIAGQTVCLCVGLWCVFNKEIVIPVAVHGLCKYVHVHETYGLDAMSMPAWLPWTNVAAALGLLRIG